MKKTARERAALAPIKNIKWVGKPKVNKQQDVYFAVFRRYPVRKPVRKVSSKRAKELREYSKRRKVFLENHTWCQTCEKIEPDGLPCPPFSNPATEIHHAAGRIGAMLNAERYWLAVCRSCHNWIHSHPSEAREKGLLK